MTNFLKCLGYIQEDTPHVSSRILSSSVCISCNIDSSWAMQEYPGRNPD